MNATEKAKELVAKLREKGLHWNGDPEQRDEIETTVAKSCAVICVEEILSMLNQYNGMHDQAFIDADEDYYRQVLEEIKKL